MFATIAGILSILMTMGLDGTQSHYFMEAKNKGTYDTKTITATILQLRIILGVGVIGLVSIFSPFIINFSFESDLPIKYLMIVAMSTFFANLISQSLDIFRLLYKPLRYIYLTAFQTLSNVGLILFFTYIMDMGIEGYFIGNLIATLIVMVTGWYATREYRCRNKIESNLYRKFLKFGLPLVPAGLMVWVMRASDRWFVMHMLGLYDTGIYAVGAKFSMILALAVETFRKAWFPIAMDMMFKKEGKEFFRKVSLWYIVGGTLSAVILTILSPYLVEFLTQKEYYESWKIVGILCWGSVFYGFYIISSRGILYSKKTYLTIYVYGSGAILNIILNFLLIPVFGLFGAAFATVFSLLFANIIGMNISNRYYKVDWPWFYMALSIFTGMTFILFYIEKY